jgi:hypothetical protein
MTPASLLTQLIEWYLQWLGVRPVIVVDRQSGKEIIEKVLLPVLAYMYTPGRC